MARRLILDVEVGDRVLWRNISATVEGVDQASSLALVSYRVPGRGLCHALVHLAELAFPPSRTPS